jgi:MscS family membrane protein
VPPLAGLVLILLAEYLIDEQINVIGVVDAASEVSMWLIALFFLAWLIFALGEVVRETIIELRHIQRMGVDASLITITVRVLSFGVACWLVLEGAEGVGLSLIPLVAGLGVGGLAVALAVRPTFENLIGGFILFIDKPVRVGDRCVFGTQEGYVEQIGLRSTRIRTLKETLVSVPNAEFAHLQLENVSKRTVTLYQTVLGLRYETTADQLRYVLTRLREILEGHPMVSPMRLRVRFLGFGDYSLNIEIFCYFRTNQFEQYWALREDLNLRIINIVEEAGTSFAFPSSTTYLGQDSGLDDERVRSVEAKVENWRREGALPTGEFDNAGHEATEDGPTRAG